MFRRRQLVRLLIEQFKIVFIICGIIFIYKDFIKVYFQRQILEFVRAHAAFFLYLMVGFFVLCSLTLIYIVWWLEWGNRRKVPMISKYVSQLICDNYYGDYRRINVYQAIRTSLSKFSRTHLEGDEDAQAHQRRLKKAREKDIMPVAAPPPERLPEDSTDGIHNLYYANGVVEKEVTYKDGKLNGVYRAFYEDGRLHHEKYYKDGKMDGIHRAFDEDGTLFFEVSYKEGKKDGVSNLYNKNGVLEYKDTYKDGVMVHRNTYSESGDVLFSQDY